MDGRSTGRPMSAPEQAGSRPQRIPGRTRILRLVLVNLVTLTAFGLLGEVGFRLFRHKRYWIRCDRVVVGSGQTRAGKKWWPETTYLIESPEFRVRFRTNSAGYRARPEPPKTDRPYRVAFVGDSFTEGMQVEVDRTFCAGIERRLADLAPGRELICENFGVASTGLFEYWHRIAHDVLGPKPPDALVLCIYPGNDFTGEFPDDGFEPDGRPRRSYFGKPGWGKHVVMWLNLKSKLGHYLVLSTFAALAFKPPPVQGPLLWWTDPAVAAGAGEAPAVRRSKALLKAIESECRRKGTRFCILVVGPVPTYHAWNGGSPLGRICADWGVDAPVIDVAVAALSRPDWWDLLFPGDGHLNEAGHAFVAAAATPPLRAALAPADGKTRLR
jgi:hypothetical protein